MRIAFNAFFANYPTNGSGQYLTSLIQALGEVNKQNEYVLLTHKEVTQTALPSKVYPVKGPAHIQEHLAKVVWEQITCPRAARAEGADLLHIPYFAPPMISPVPTVVTIQDVIPLRLPAYRPAGKVRFYMELAAKAAHRATMVIAISNHAKKDIMDVLHIPEERIRVIYQAIGPEYRPVADSEKIRTARERYGLRERYIFYIGGLDQRKNVRQLVRAFAHLQAQLHDTDLQLFISGNPDKQKGPLFPDPRPVAADLGMSGKIIYRFVEEEDKPAIYSGASLFVFPSIYEGFGLPPLEAMGCGLPVICSNRTSLPEVVGDAAILIDPDNVQALVEAMRDVLTNEALQAKLRARSLERAKLFSWHKTAQETLAIYQEVLIRKKKG
jgi:glycosyltransferase involved in cell wall biosynthesis